MTTSRGILDPTPEIQIRPKESEPDPQLLLEKNYAYVVSGIFIRRDFPLSARQTVVYF